MMTTIRVITVCRLSPYRKFTASLKQRAADSELEVTPCLCCYSIGWNYTGNEGEC